MEFLILDSEGHSIIRQYILVIISLCWILATPLVNLVNLPHCLGSRTIVEPQYALHGHFQ